MKKVAAAIAIKNGKILIAKRAAHLKLAGYWEFPGGKLEGTETISECIVRELQEEFSIPCDTGEIITSSVYEYEHGCFEIIGIIVYADFSSAILVDHDEIKWVDIAELLDYKLAPADIPIAQYIMEHVNEF
jgi:8-oxo-dGTP diphosphatase